MKLNKIIIGILAIIIICSAGSYKSSYGTDTHKLNDLKPNDLPSFVSYVKNCVYLVKSDNGLGTAFVINTQGYFLTCAHVVGSSDTVLLINNAEVLDPNAINARFETQIMKASVKATNPRYDLAVLKVNLAENGLNDMPFLRLANSDSLKEGQDVFSVAFLPYDLIFKEPRAFVSKGIISTIRKNVKLGNYNCDVIQSNLSTALGNSGGPLLIMDLFPRVVGYIDAGFFDKNTIQSSYSIALTIKQVAPFLDSLQIPFVYGWGLQNETKGVKK